MGLLTVDTAVEYLATRGLIDAAGATATELGGGVSNVVLSVSDATRDLVVKQSLPRLRVADEWLAPQGRVITEAVALELAGSMSPDAVPRVLHRDPDHHTIVLEKAGDGATDWKARLLSGHVDAAVAGRLGRTLGEWHRSTRGVTLPAELDDTEPFELLRVDPYYRTVARRVPAVAAPVTALAERMLTRRECLVHGDFSPKNILVGPGSHTWVIDFEVAHRGDPAFDLAFLLTHLLMKSVHLPHKARGLDECARSFVAAYRDSAGAELVPPWSYVFGHVGCLLLARVRGKSPAEYLTEPERAQVWALGASLLDAAPSELAQVQQRRDGVLA